MPKPLQGVLPIVQTPFLDSDEIDEAALQCEVDWAFEHGIHGHILTAPDRFSIAPDDTMCDSKQEERQL